MIADSDSRFVVDCMSGHASSMIASNAASTNLQLAMCWIRGRISAIFSEDRAASRRVSYCCCLRGRSSRTQICMVEAITVSSKLKQCSTSSKVSQIHLSLPDSAVLSLSHAWAARCTNVDQIS